MGNNYSVNLNVMLGEDNGRKAICELRKFMKEPEKHGFVNGIDWGVDIDSLCSLEDFILVMLANNNTKVCIVKEKDGSFTYRNDFSCSYGWESVMLTMWEIIGSHLDGSYFCSVDEGEYGYESKNGMIVKVHDEDY